MKRVNPTSTSCSTPSKVVEEEIKKRLEERNKQDQKYFPTLPLPSRPCIPKVLQG
jgi:hypothetical protein